MLDSFSFFRIELSNTTTTAEHEELLRRDAAVIQDIRNTLKSLKPTQHITEQQKETGSIVAVSRRDLSQLVAVRRAHQTKRAARSTKTRSNPHDTILENTNESDHQQLHSQMVEVVNRVGTGLERSARWRSGTAPGTRSAEETLALAGNSANAEYVAKERVNKVHGSHL